MKLEPIEVVMLAAATVGVITALLCISGLIYFLY